MAVTNEDDLLLSLYLDGELAPEAEAGLERRLASEPELGERLEAMRRLQEMSAGLVFLRARPRRRWWPAAAAALLLALTHAAAFATGVLRDGVREPTGTERLLQRAASLDPGAPYEQLRTELAGLRREVERTPLSRIASALDRYEDPGFLGILVKRIARGEAPPPTRFHTRVFPLGQDRYSVITLDTASGEIRTDEGTVEELRSRNIFIRLTQGG